MFLGLRSAFRFATGILTHMVCCEGFSTLSLIHPMFSSSPKFAAQRHSSQSFFHDLVESPLVGSSTSRPRRPRLLVSSVEEGVSWHRRNTNHETPVVSPSTKNNLVSTTTPNSNPQHQQCSASSPLRPFCTAIMLTRCPVGFSRPRPRIKGRSRRV